MKILITILLLTTTVKAQQTLPLQAQRVLIASAGNTVAAKEITGLFNLTRRMYVASQDGSGVYTGLSAGLYAFYPMLGSSLNSVKWNLINTSTYTLTASGSPTYSNGIVTFNGTTTTLNTNFNPSTNGTTNMGIFIEAHTNYGNAGCAMGANTSSAAEVSIWPRDGGDAYYAVNSNEGFVTNATALGIYSVQRVSSGASNVTLYKGGSALSTSTLTGSSPNANIFIGGLRAGLQLSALTTGFAGIISANWSSTQHAELYNIVNLFKTEAK